MPIRCERTSLLRFAVTGLILMAPPLAGGVCFLIFFPLSWWSILLAMICFALFLLVIRPVTRMYQWVEIDGTTVRGLRFWTRRIVETDASQLFVVKASLGLFQDRQRGGATGVPQLEATNYQIVFKDGFFIFLGCLDMTRVDEFMEALIADRATGLRFPVILGGLRFGGVMVFDEPHYDRNYAYYHRDGLTATVYIYDKGHAPMADGIDTTIVRDEFETNKRFMFTGDEEESNESDAGESASPESQDTEEDKAGAVTHQSDPTDDIIRLGDGDDAPQMLTSTVTFKVHGEPMVTRLYLTVYGGYFLKIRCTMAEDDQTPWQPLMERLANAVGSLIGDASR